MGRTYRLIDTDTHVNEPPDLWVDRLSAKHKDRAPRIESFDQGDAWVLDGVADPITFGLNATAGMDPAQMQQWVRWEDVRRGGYDPKERIAEMDRDQIDAQTLFPTPRLSHWLFAQTEPDFHLAVVRAYNDWLGEYCAHDPERFGGMIMLPNRGVDMAVDELHRCLEMPGMRGALMGCYPHGELEIADEDEALWRALAEAGVPLHIHVALVNELPKAHKAKLPGDVRFYDAPKRILEFVYSGVFDRIPDLKLVMVEVDCGWLPYVKEQVDDRYRRQGFASGLELENPPSWYFENHIWFTWITDHYAIRNRHDVGVDKMMWSSDYPHVGSNWPNSWRVIASDFSGVPPVERDAMLAGNAAALYGFGA